MVVCMGQGADDSIWSSSCHCHPVISCFIKIQTGLLAYPGCPRKEAIKQFSWEMATKTVIQEKQFMFCSCSGFVSEALDRRLLFVKNIPKSATEAQVKALHGGIVNVQLRALKWSHRSKQQYQ